ncbi:MAG TPA: AmmeMemoRadiSam system protein B [Sulfuricurvum sp.]|nr:MAG: AmmeMemoRadiSam system protein B [Campylobacterales bacterium 16-40-21]OZA03852.1 MAG: AmmeMemoRadiSam system protein B [Sulfuricurvum sp. 17-40-25]HQS65628.1 AmmeMemoRadiSam system protein B [Sulfuricurvum sp.]HQT36134.1 AmmeMemoRadiSam system protein B [Sulfuricurvum sp.]
MSYRTMSVSGSFYPENSDEINSMIERFNAILDSQPDMLKRFDSLTGNTIIVPHAGWIYSGFTANIAFRILAKINPKTVIVIGPSHRVGFEGVSIADAQSYQTPLGDLTIDQSFVTELQHRFSIPYLHEAHHEHSTEVQMPFIKYYLPHTQVVELVYAYAQPELIEPIITYLVSLQDTAVVISTDLSHYYTLDEAQQLDSICLDAIEKEDTDMLNKGCEACGMVGVHAMLTVAKKKGLKSTILDYRTSADASGDTSRVVGYMSALFHAQART